MYVWMRLRICPEASVTALSWRGFIKNKIGTVINDKEISVHPTSSAPARVVAGAAEVVVSLEEAPGAPQ